MLIFIPEANGFEDISFIPFNLCSHVLWFIISTHYILYLKQTANELVGKYLCLLEVCVCEREREGGGGFNKPLKLNDEIF